MDRQILNRTAGLRATDLYTPAIIDKATHHVGREGKRRIRPQVFVVIRTFDFFDIVEAANRNGIRAIWQASQYAGHHQTDVASVVRIAERFPLDVLGAIKIVANIFNRSDVFH